MSYLRFNHVFLGLMALALISAFVVPPRAGDRLKGPVNGIFSPIAYLSGRVGEMVRSRVSPSPAVDVISPDKPRDIETVRKENQQLHVQLLNLKSQLDMLIEREDSRSRLGELRTRCTPVTVLGTDTGPRESLVLGGISSSGFRDGMAVMYAGGLVGRLGAVGVGGARVTLITDPSIRMTAIFTRAVHSADGSIDYQDRAIEPKLVEGKGKGTMTARITEDDRKNSGLQKDDWAVLLDGEWPRELRRFRIGYVESIEPTRDPGFLLVTIRPDQDLRLLQEVMVMNKE